MRFEGMKTCFEFTSRTVEISGSVLMYYYPNGTSEIENRIFIEFLSTKDKDTTYLHVKRCLEEIHNKVVIKEMTEAKGSKGSRSISIRFGAGSY